MAAGADLMGICTRQGRDEGVKWDPRPPHPEVGACLPIPPPPGPAFPKLHYPLLAWPSQVCPCLRPLYYARLCCSASPSFSLLRPCLSPTESELSDKRRIGPLLPGLLKSCSAIERPEELWLMTDDEATASPQREGGCEWLRDYHQLLSLLSLQIIHPSPAPGR